MRRANRWPSPVRSYPSAIMNAPNMSHTVGLLYPESAQVRAALAGWKPGWDNSWGLNSTNGASTETSVNPIIAIAAPGKGSRTNPTITPAKIEKYNQATCGHPGGDGTRARTTATATGTIASHLLMGDSARVGVTLLVTF